jgi:hypothetical protein
MCPRSRSGAWAGPRLPTAAGQKLMDLGLSQPFAQEAMTLNVPEIPGGSLGLIGSGADVFACFSNAIPHTFLAAGIYLGLGVSVGPPSVVP